LKLCCGFTITGDYIEKMWILLNPPAALILISANSVQTTIYVNMGRLKMNQSFNEIAYGKGKHYYILKHIAGLA